MRTLFTTSLVFCLALLLAAPATAQDAERVTLTFRLTLRGEVPDREEFRMVFVKSNELPPGEFRFCGKATAFEPDLKPCEGGGTVYTETVTVLTDEPGIEVSYSYSRSIPLRRGGFTTELFFYGSVPADRDRTVSAYFTYAEAGGDQQEAPDNQQGGVPDNQQAPPDDADAEDGMPGLPATGGGGSAP